MQKQFRLVSMVGLLVVGAGSVGVQWRALGKPPEIHPESVARAHIAVTDRTGDVGLYTVEDTPSGWRITGARVGYDGVAHQIDFRQGGELFIPATGATGATITTGSIDFEADFEAIGGTSGTEYCRTTDDGQNVLIMVSPDATGPGSPGDPQAAGFWGNFWDEIRRRIEELLNFCVHQATATCGSGNVCGVTTSAGPEGITCSFTCCGPQAPTNGG